MILTEDQIKQVAASSKAGIQEANEREMRLKMNVFGKDYVDFLARKASLETKEQFNLRKKHSVSNRGFWSAILNKVDRVFDAKGGSAAYFAQNIDPAKVKAAISPHVNSNGNDNTLMQFVSDTWENLIMTSPDAFTVIDGARDSNVVGGFIYTPIPMSKITNFKRKGKGGYEYVCYSDGSAFQTNNKHINVNLKGSRTIYNVIDDFANYVVIRENGVYTIAPFDEPLVFEKEQYVSTMHGFTECPAVANSNIVFDDNKNRKSPVWDAMEESEKLMEENSTRTGFKYLHGYPVFWMFNLSNCPVCNGTGSSGVGEQCANCGGTGTIKKDVTNVLTIEPQEDINDPVIPVPNVAGYVSPPVDVWKQMNEDIEKNKDEISQIFWGTNIEAIANRTAAGQIIDEQPVVAKLSKLTKSAEVFINTFANLIGGFVFGNSFTEASISLGNTYLIQSPSALLEQYNAITGVGNDALKTRVLLDYWQHKLSKQPAEYIRKEKEIFIEPYPHNSVADVLLMSISSNLKRRKMYFSEWNSMIQNSEYVTKDISQLRDLLDLYTIQFIEEEPSANEDVKIIS